MAAAETPKQRAPRRSWSLSEKRRIVELTLRPGASLSAIAREHGVSTNSLCKWKARYRAGKLGATAVQLRGASSRATFVPVRVPLGESVAQPNARAAQTGSGVLHVTLASGASLRVEAAPLDAPLLCALLAELRR